MIQFAVSVIHIVSCNDQITLEVSTFSLLSRGGVLLSVPRYFGRVLWRVEIFLVAYCYRNWNMLRWNGPLCQTHSSLPTFGESLLMELYVIDLLIRGSLLTVKTRIFVTFLRLRWFTQMFAAFSIPHRGRVGTGSFSRPRSTSTTNAAFGPLRPHRVTAIHISWFYYNTSILMASQSS